MKNLVHNSVQETLNVLLDHEAEELVNTKKYEPSDDRKGYRSGHYRMNFQTTARVIKYKTFLSLSPLVSTRMNIMKSLEQQKV